MPFKANSLKKDCASNVVKGNINKDKEKLKGSVIVLPWIDCCCFNILIFLSF